MTPAEHAATVLEVLSDEAISPHPDDWGGTRAKAYDSLQWLRHEAERATELEVALRMEAREIQQAAERMRMLAEGDS
jgi:hypothetical protein